MNFAAFGVVFFSLYLNICRLQTGSGKFFMGVLESSLIFVGKKSGNPEYGTSLNTTQNISFRIHRDPQHNLTLIFFVHLNIWIGPSGALQVVKFCALLEAGACSGSRFDRTEAIREALIWLIPLLFGVLTTKRRWCIDVLCDFLPVTSVAWNVRLGVLYLFTASSSNAN